MFNESSCWGFVYNFEPRDSWALLGPGANRGRYGAGIRVYGIRYTGIRVYGIRYTGIRYTGIRYTGIRVYGYTVYGNLPIFAKNESAQNFPA